MRTTPRVSLKDYTQAGQLEVDEGSLDKNSSLYLMLQQVGRRKDVLDVGCSSGYLAKLMSSNDCNVVGIEINPEVAETARKYCSQVFVADLDFVGLADAVEGRTFDVIVFGDVLEHLRNPARILDEARSLLRADGYVVASIPNIAHGAIRLALLRGDFDYKEIGILDETHLRFFTLKTIEEMLLEAGYEIKRIDRTKVDVFGNSSELSAVPDVSREEFDEETIARVQQDPEFDTLQFVIQALPLSDEARLRAVTKRFVKANTDLTHAKNVIERQKAQLTKTHEQMSSSLPTLEAEKSRLQTLQSELQARAVEREALAADRDMWRSRVTSELPVAQSEIARLSSQAFDLEQRSADISTERDRLRAELQERGAEIARLTAYVSDLQLRVDRQGAPDGESVSAQMTEVMAERDAVAADRELWRAKVSAELPAAQAEIARLTGQALDLQHRAAQREAIHAETLAERDRLHAELQQRAEERRALASDRDAWRAKVSAELPAAQAERDRLLSDLQARATEREALTADRDAWRARVSAELPAAQAELARLTAAISAASAERDRLLSELQARATEREALAADRDAWRAKVSAELPAAQAELARLTAAISATSAERDRLLSELQAHAKEREVLVAERETLAADRDAWRAKVSAELPAAQAEIVRLKVDQEVALVERNRLSAEAGELRVELAKAEAEVVRVTGNISELRQALTEREAAHADMAAGFAREIAGLRSQLAEIDVLQRESDTLKREIESVKVERDGASVMARQQALVAQRMQQTVGQSNVRIAALEDELANLSATLRVTHDEMLKVQAEIVKAQSALTDRESEAKQAVEHIAALQSALTARDSEVDGAVKHIASLENQVGQLQNRLLDQTNQYLASTQAENQRLALLIDTVQSSRFWKIKRILGRFRQALAG
jgi:2-polyprenyl-3-methyl-5-hydroxy-6-metoxy-1,4-benzoquinol methylase/chromosome segregation ATPase